MSESTERRRDVGIKTLYGILTVLIAFVLSIIFFETYRKADAAVTGVAETKKDVAVIQESIKGINKNFDTVNDKLDILVGWRK
jgi:hypothetical protein